ncbi:MAG: GatB/YqeY domain-containing protein [Candidatus Moranbacteria bacterium]|nr:GatB/YqeY domain-containing protein [Candidatus Moranbacteria bacterium]NTW46191.1 GatB/YqeY domain-containing protein [Candidatus Moranbacteria bacterium]
MSLYESVQSGLKDAMKAGDAERRDTIRMIGSALKNEAIEKRVPVAELADPDAVAVLRRLVKQRRESAETYRAGGREDLAVKEESEIGIVSGFLPADLPEAEIRSIIDEAKAETGVVDKAGFGKLMGAVSKKIAGRADGATVKRLVEESLT